MPVIGSVTTIIDTDIRRFTTGIRTAQSQLVSFGKAAKLTGQGIKSFGRRLTIGLTLPLVAIGVATAKLASDAEETAAKFETVFEGVGDTAKKVAKEFAKNFGLASSTSKKLLSDTGDLLSGFGFTDAAALDLSIRTNELAADLVSFSNVEGGVTRASQALTKALLGERESIKLLGIAILDEDVKKQVAIQTAKGLKFATERQAKAFATLTLAQEQSKKAIGDVERTWNSTANTARRLQEQVKELAEEFGELVIEILGVTRIMEAMGKQIIKAKDFFENVSPAMKKFIGQLLVFAAVAGPTIIILGELVENAGPLIKLLTGVTFFKFIAGFIVLAPKMLLVGIIFASLISLIVTFVGEGETMGEKFKDIFGKITSGIKNVIKNFDKFRKTALLALQLAFIGLKFEIKDIVNTLDAAFFNIFQTIDFLVVNFLTALRLIGEFWKKTFTNIARFTVDIFQFLVINAARAGKAIIEGLKGKGFDFDLIELKDILREPLKIDIETIDFMDFPEMRDAFAESAKLQIEKAKQIEKALAFEMTAALKKTAEDAGDKIKEAMDVGGAVKKFSTTPLKFAGAFEKGTAEALKAELGGKKVEDKIEKNTREVKELTKEILSTLRKNVTLPIFQVEIPTVSIPI